MFIMLVGPLWLLIAASALQVVPDLRGQWMMDGQTGEVAFVEYSFFVMWFRGGFIATAFMGAAAPLLVIAADLTNGFGRYAAFRQTAAPAPFTVDAGLSEIDVPLVVRKRKKGSSAVAAATVRVVPASPLRRLIARVADLALLGLSACGGALMVHVVALFWEIDTATLNPLVSVGASALFSLWLIRSQWAFLSRHGQTFGKFLVDIRVIDRSSDDAIAFLRVVVFRQLIPGVLGLGVAAVSAWVGFVGLGPVLDLSGALVFGFLDGALMDGDFTTLEGVSLRPFVDMSRAEPLAAGVAAIAGWLLWEGVHTLPLIFDLQAPHDALASSRVVRTSVAAPGPLTVPLGFRLAAVAVDVAGAAAVAGLPLAALVVYGQTASGDVNPLVVLGLVLASLAGLLVYLALQAARIVRTGATVGKAMLGLQVVTADGGPAGFTKGVLAREVLGRGLLWVVLPGFGVLVDTMAALGDDRLALHDQIAQCRVVWAATSARSIKGGTLGRGPRVSSDSDRQSG